MYQVFYKQYAHECIPCSEWELREGITRKLTIPHKHFRQSRGKNTKILNSAALKVSLYQKL